MIEIVKCSMAQPENAAIFVKVMFTVIVPGGKLSARYTVYVRGDRKGGGERERKRERRALRWIDIELLSPLKK